MNTAPRRPCQTACLEAGCLLVSRAVSYLGAAFLFLAMAAGICAEPASQPSANPSPVPAWQNELETARVLEGSLLLAPSKDAAEAAARSQRLDQLYRDLAGKYPDRSAIQKASGEYAWRHSRSAEAIPLLLRAQSLEPGDGDTADLLGSAYLHLGRTREAGSQFQRAVDASPEEPRYHFDLANVLYLFRNDLAYSPALPDADAALAKSLDEFRHAAALAPGDLRYAKAYAETFYVFAHPDWEKALAAWESVLALSSPDTDFANSHLARISLRLKRPAEAEGYLARIQNPKFDALKAKLQATAAKQPRSTPAASP